MKEYNREILYVLIPDKVINVFAMMASSAMVKHVIHCLNAVKPFILTVRVKISPFIQTERLKIIPNNMISFVLIPMLYESTKLTPARVTQQTNLRHG